MKFIDYSYEKKVDVFNPDYIFRLDDNDIDLMVDALRVYIKKEPLAKVEPALNIIKTLKGDN